MSTWKRYLLVIIVILALVPQSSAAKRRVLIDRGHDEKLGTLDKEPRFDIFEDVYKITESDKEITYKNIKEYDMLFIAMPQKSFDLSEIEVITRFVENGGGLLLSKSYTKDRTILESINSISTFFEVEFTNSFWRGPVVIEVQAEIHPVFHEVRKINLQLPNTLIVEEPSEELLNLELESIMAYCEYGKGRIFFLTSQDIFVDEFIELFDNQQFAANILNWLTEPGGPYLQQKPFLEEGLTLMEKGKEQIKSSEFSLAKNTLNRSESALENALTIYESNTTESMIESVKSLIAEAESGITADALFLEGTTLYESGQFSSALQTLQEAQQLFQSINAESEECALLIQECEAEILLSEGIAYFEQEQYESAKTTLEEALSAFTALQNDEKVAECKEWIVAVEEQITSGEPPEQLNITGIVLGVVVVLSIIIVSILQMRKGKVKEELEPGKKQAEQEKALPEETAEEKEIEPPKITKCPFCNHEIQEDWVSCPHCSTKLKEDTQIY